MGPCAVWRLVPIFRAASHHQQQSELSMPASPTLIHFPLFSHHQQASSLPFPLIIELPLALAAAVAAEIHFLFSRSFSLLAASGGLLATAKE